VSYDTHLVSLHCTLLLIRRLGGVTFFLLFSRSMYPLMLKDGLALASFALCALFAALVALLAAPASSTTCAPCIPSATPVSASTAGRIPSGDASTPSGCTSRVYALCRWGRRLFRAVMVWLRHGQWLWAQVRKIACVKRALALRTIVAAVIGRRLPALHRDAPLGSNSSRPARPLAPCPHGVCVRFLHGCLAGGTCATVRPYQRRRVVHPGPLRVIMCSCLREFAGCWFVFRSQ